MAGDTGVMKFDKNAVGRWISDTKDDRTRQVCFISKDEAGKEFDQTYVGFYHDVNKPGMGCNIAIAFDEKEVCIQVIEPGSRDVRFISWTPSEFMDRLESLLPTLKALAK